MTRTALGHYIVAAKGGRLRDAARWVQQTEFGARVERAANRTSHAAERRPHPLRSLRTASGRRQWALALMLAEGWRRGTSAGARVAQHQLARRLRVSIRTVQRDLECLEAAGLVTSWQPPAEALPAHLRGRIKEGPDGEQWQFAYKLYRWAVSLPREIWIALQRWRVSGYLPAWERQPRPSAPEPYAPSTEAGRAAMERMRALSQRLAPDG